MSKDNNTESIIITGNVDYKSLNHQQLVLNNVICRLKGEATEQDPKIQAKELQGLVKFLGRIQYNKS